MQRNRWWIKVLNVPVMERSAECRRSAENRPDWRVPGGRTWSRDSSRGVLHPEPSDSAGTRTGGRRRGNADGGTRTNSLTLDVAEVELGLLSEFGRGSAKESNRQLSVGGRGETVGPTPPPLRFGWNRSRGEGGEGYSRLGKFYVAREENATVRWENNFYKLFLLEVIKNKSTFSCLV